MIENWRFPFDTENPFGYLAACSLQYIHLAFESFFVSNLISLAIGAYLYAMTAIDDLKGILRSINVNCVKTKTNDERRLALNQIREFVDMHSALKQLSNNQSYFSKSRISWQFNRTTLLILFLISLFLQSNWAMFEYFTTHDYVSVCVELCSTLF